MMYPGWVKLRICQRLDNWQDVADYFDVPPHAKRRFERGDEPRGLWEYLEVRDQLTGMPNALDAVGRPDLADVLRALTHESVDRADLIPVARTGRPSVADISARSARAVDGVHNEWLAKRYARIQQIRQPERYQRPPNSRPDKRAEQFERNEQNALDERKQQGARDEAGERTDQGEQRDLGEPGQVWQGDISPNAAILVGRLLAIVAILTMAGLYVQLPWRDRRETDLRDVTAQEAYRMVLSAQRGYADDEPVDLDSGRSLLNGDVTGDEFFYRYFLPSGDTRPNLALRERTDMAVVDDRSANERACLDALAQPGSDSSLWTGPDGIRHYNLIVGQSFCITTSNGNVAHVSVVSIDSDGSVVLDVVVLRLDLADRRST